MKRFFGVCLGLIAATLLVAACQPAAIPFEPTEKPAIEREEIGKIVGEETLPPAATSVPEGEAVVGTPSMVIAPTQPVPTSTSVVEQRMVELEWPATVRYGDSDTVRLALIPSEEGYTVTTEFPEHQTDTEDIEVARPEGYELFAVARLDGVGFTITPAGERPSLLPVGKGITWRWTLRPKEVGQQHLSVTLFLRWIPIQGESVRTREAIIYSRSMKVRVISFFGLTRRQAMTGGLLGLIFGGGLSLYTLISLLQPDGRSIRERTRPGMKTPEPNLNLILEQPLGLVLSVQERGLYQTLFRRYDRVVIESEFPTGYSGARTFLTLPIRQDGRADAYTVVKIDQAEKVQREFENYENLVKHTLPPITARIQQAPVVTRKLGVGVLRLAALQYTFIAEPGRMPVSLRKSLLNRPDAKLLWKLFETFGPNWWMQRRPYTFRLAQEYDRLLPPHYIVEPAKGKGHPLDGESSPGELTYEVGDQVTLQKFECIERRLDRQSLSLKGKAAPGCASLRVYWQSLDDPNGANGRIAATRWTELNKMLTNFDLYGLADPIAKLAELLNEKVSGTLATIHGDLNLENVLVGPGEMVWLIDFATTRDGHTLYDFAHLKAEIITHVIAPQIKSEQEYMHLLSGEGGAAIQDLGVLLEAVDGIAQRCLFNPSQPKEYDLAVFMACVGALKYQNLDRHQKHLLYLTAGYTGQGL